MGKGCALLGTSIPFSQECLAHVSLAINVPVNGHFKLLRRMKKQAFNLTQ